MTSSASLSAAAKPHPQPPPTSPAGTGLSRFTRWTTKRSVRLLAARLVCVAAAGITWQYLVVSKTLTPDAVAAPSDLFKALGRLLQTGAFWSDIGATLRTWAIGLGISLLLALPTGLLLGSSDLAYRMSRVTVDFLRTIPPVALLPLALLMYGASYQMALVLVVFGSVWPLLLQTMYGVHQTDPVLTAVARSYRLCRRDRTLAIILPSAAPFIATGIRIAATISLLLAVGAELLGGTAGIGNAITQAQQAQDMPAMYAFVVVAALLGGALNLAMAGIERRVLAWHPAHRNR